MSAKNIAKICHMGASEVPPVEIASALDIDLEHVIQVLDQYNVDYQYATKEDYVYRPRLY